MIMSDKEVLSFVNEMARKVQRNADKTRRSVLRQMNIVEEDEKEMLRKEMEKINDYMTKHNLAIRKLNLMFQHNMRYVG